ncbi:E3 ubiquitin-protein ligase Rnf220 [Drosophila sulfurigaster albostrigata]|uniref:E3 ubiquitin-protein ligase Rnf220 n=1 Tax=Drosophila sulfurigaster albostrigata TaxID=89887 RepID=UPI002D21BB67|nr:E3 ubiquitin-protein ligase Rnf220 [Drosophila sulfurigaster albostrigata]
MATDTVPNSENFTLASSEEDVICPTCDAKIKRSQVADHCQVEMDRLHSMQLRSTDSTASQAASATASTTTTTTESNSTAVEGGQRKPWTVFQRVQRNRQARQRQRTRKRPTPPPPSAPALATAPATSQATQETTSTSSSNSCICPVCNKNFPQAQIQEHANQCLRSSRRNGQSNGERQQASSDDDDDSEEYEEYEWAGQKRIRVSTLVQGGYGSLSLGQTIKYNGGQQANDDDDDVNVDEDDTHIYGPTQYGEADVIPLANEDADEGGVSEADVTSYVRRLISSNETPKSSNVNHSASETNEQTTEAMDEAATAASLEPSTSQGTTPSTSRSSRSATQNQAHNQQQIIESLKARLRLYEKQAQSKFKCLICIDDYKNPAISVSCWHVHCEQCWLQTLGARKLCPQCNSITTPKDLRRIYL